MGQNPHYKKARQRFASVALVTSLACVLAMPAMAQQFDDDLRLKPRDGEEEEAPISQYLRRLNGEIEASQSANDDLFGDDASRQQQRDQNQQDAAPEPVYQPAVPQIVERRDTTAEDPFAVPEPQILAEPRESYQAARNAVPMASANREFQDFDEGADLDDNAAPLITGTTPNRDSTDGETLGNSLDPRTSIAVGSEAERIARTRLANTGINPLKARGAGSAIAEPPLDANIVPRDGAPYAPVGVKLGSWLLRPTLTTGAETTLNDGDSGTGAFANLNVSGEGFIGRTDLTLDANIDLSGAFDGDIDPNGNIDLGAVHSVTNMVDIFGNLGYGIGDANITGGLDNDESVTTTLHELDGSAGIRVNGAKTAITASLGVNRQSYDALPLSSIFQEDRSNTTFSGALRLGYQATPVMTPFAQAIVSRRMMENDLTVDGYDFSGYEYDASIGTGFDFGDKWNGEVSVGWIRLTYDDARIDDVDSLALRGLINWSPQRDTNVSLELTTETDPGIGVTYGPSTTYGATGTINHQLRDNLTMAARLGYSFQDRQCTCAETQMTAEIDANYWFNRTFGISANASHEITSSDDDGTSSATSFRLGLIFQR